MVRFYIIISIGIALLQSCSLKENRDICPCWMEVEIFGQVGHDDALILRLRGNSDEDAADYAFNMTEVVRADAGDLEYEVPRGTVGVSAVNLARLHIPSGEQMDSLYGFFQMYQTQCESVLCEVQLHKEFCTVSFTLGDDGYVSPYKLEVLGNVTGVSACDLMPMCGDFRFAPVPKDGVYRVRVPRQVDNSLELVMLDNSEIVDRLPLGEYIARSGYDWSTEDLADVSVTLDLERQQVMITVSDWDDVVVMDIVI